MTLLRAGNILARTSSPAAKAQGRLREMTMADLPILASMLVGQSGPDHYLLSAAYHGFTGRHGLWVYEEGDDFILFCHHPNVVGKILVFPGTCSVGARLTKNFLQAGYVNEYSVQLARIEGQVAASLADQMTWTSGLHSFRAKDEDVLDWLYPVHTLSTPLVCNHAGGDFKDFRKNTHRAADVSTASLNINAHYFDLMALCQRWAADHESPGYSVEDLVAPHAYILRMVRESGLDLRGCVLSMEGRLVAFAVWEMPVAPGRAAVSVTSLTHGSSRGLSERLYLEMCRALAKDGIERVCIGGSETASLDAYKRKMCPVESLSLKSVAVSPVDQAFFSGLPINTSLSAPSKTSCE